MVSYERELAARAAGFTKKNPYPGRFGRDRIGDVEAYEKSDIFKKRQAAAKKAAATKKKKEADAKKAKEEAAKKEAAKPDVELELIQKLKLRVWIREGLGANYKATWLTPDIIDNRALEFKIHCQMFYVEIDDLAQAANLLEEADRAPKAEKVTTESKSVKFKVSVDLTVPYVQNKDTAKKKPSEQWMHRLIVTKSKQESSPAITCSPQSGSYSNYAVRIKTDSIESINEIVGKEYELVEKKSS